MEQAEVNLEELEKFVHEKDRKTLRKRIGLNKRESHQEIVSKLNYQRGLAADFKLYPIVYGDTLSEIAERFDLDMSRVAFVNGIENIDLIREGQILSLSELR